MRMQTQQLKARCQSGFARPAVPPVNSPIRRRLASFVHMRGIVSYGCAGRGVLVLSVRELALPSGLLRLQSRDQYGLLFWRWLGRLGRMGLAFRLGRPQHYGQ